MILVILSRSGPSMCPDRALQSSWLRPLSISQCVQGKGENPARVLESITTMLEYSSHSLLGGVTSGVSASKMSSSEMGSGAGSWSS